jgi:hypothetical protein
MPDPGRDLGKACATITKVGEMTWWLPARASWADTNGTVWTQSKPHRLTEADAKRFAWRKSTRVAVEHTPGNSDVEWLDPASLKDYWARRVAGHIEDGTDGCVHPNDKGLTYHASGWRDSRGHHMILLSEIC